MLKASFYIERVSIVIHEKHRHPRSNFEGVEKNTDQYRNFEGILEYHGKPSQILSQRVSRERIHRLSCTESEVFQPKYENTRDHYKGRGGIESSRDPARFRV